MNVMKNAHRILLTLLAVAAAAACGEAIDINRVQPNVLDKRMLNGEWYFRSTVVDKQYNTDMVFIGVEGGLERVRWEITEKELVAYRSYERIPGSDPSNPGDQNVIASFPIESHFDIRRQYNPTNGVETNVIEENDYDRPWYERQYIRVDWANEVGVAWDLGSQSGILSVPGNVCGGAITGSPYLQMQGNQVFKFAVKVLDEVARETAEAAGIPLESVDWLIPHQANVRILEATAKKLGLPRERLVVTVDQHGNASAASVPLSLDVAVRDGRIQRGDTLMLEGVGGGFTWGAVLLNY